MLGCKVFELSVGDEFSYDEGYSWVVVRTEPRYRDMAPECLQLIFMVSSEEHPGIGFWVEVEFEDDRHVLLDKNWGKDI